MPTGRETQGIGVLRVLSDWESQLHGEAGQVERGKHFRGSRDDLCSGRKYHGTLESRVRRKLHARFGGGALEKCLLDK